MEWLFSSTRAVPKEGQTPRLENSETTHAGVTLPYMGERRGNRWVTRASQRSLDFDKVLYPPRPKSRGGNSRGGYLREDSKAPAGCREVLGFSSRAQRQYEDQGTRKSLEPRQAALRNLGSKGNTKSKVQKDVCPHSSRTTSQGHSCLSPQKMARDQANGGHLRDSKVDTKAGL